MRKFFTFLLAAWALISAGPAFAQFDGSPGARPRAGVFGTARAPAAGLPLGCTVFLGTATAASGTGTMTVSNIPPGFRELIVFFTGGSTNANLNIVNGLGMQVNGDTTAGHYGNGGTGWYNGGSGAISGQTVAFLSSNGGYPTYLSYAVITIQNYTISNGPVSWVGTSIAYQGSVGTWGTYTSGTWFPASPVHGAVTSIRLFDVSGNNFVVPSSMTVCGRP